MFIEILFQKNLYSPFVNHKKCQFGILLEFIRKKTYLSFRFQILLDPFAQLGWFHFILSHSKCLMYNVHTQQ
jgi:hypothetical protein